MYGSATPDPATPRAGDTIRAASPAPGPLGRRRRSASPLPEDAARGRRRNPVKVSRACDFCKVRKAKCNGMIPCDKCVVKGRVCLYDTKYSRGRPPTPPPSVAQLAGLGAPGGGFRCETPGVASSVSRSASGLGASASPRPPATREIPAGLRPTADREPIVTPSRTSPELDMAEIQGQVFDPTSGLTFLHRAWKRLARQHSTPVAPTDQIAHQQPWTLAGDKPLPQREGDRVVLPPHGKARELLSLYFDVCIATYRFLHRGTTLAWLESVERSLDQGGPAWVELGKPRTAIVLTVLAIASIHCERSCADKAAVPSGICADELFCMASSLTDTETGFPSLESAQVRLIQVLYLLTTSRMNRAWYTFGSVVQIIAALGLHRRPDRKRGLTSGGDYIRSQCSIRTFWAAYILDQHLGVIFGRPRHYHDEDIDQEFPASVDDEFMTAQGRIEKSDEHEDAGSDCLIDALVFHAKIAQIIGQISKEVYSIKPTSEQDRVAAAHRLGTHLHDWRASLPPHLGSIRPSSLIPSLRRQATVLRLAYSHAIMHANRLFLLGSPSVNREPRVAECVGAARVVFETVDGLAREGPLFYSFWWTHYVTFCALLVTYVWEIRQGGRGLVNAGDEGHERLLELASRCHRHLANATATNSPSRRYAVILEEFRREATGRVPRHPSPPQEGGGEQAPRPSVPPPGRAVVNWQPPLEPVSGVDYAAYDVPHIAPGSALLDEWQTTDWLDLDSSAFGPYIGMDVASMQWLPNGDFTAL